jgi:hypothetical protein
LVKRNREQGGRKKGKQRGVTTQSGRGLGFTGLSCVEDKKGSRLAGSVVVEKGGGAHAFSVVLAEGKKAWPWEEEEHASCMTCSDKEEYWLVGPRRK